ncbi:DUF5615 family PIN-like protein [Cyclobacterium plantarum]|uniref:DUF5615 family PIN-like protein n=1 Tax=Cyclobacterium plantarum TaxID=2716263 RepID=UPI003F6FECEC
MLRGVKVEYNPGYFLSKLKSHRSADVVVMSKDDDFVQMLEKNGPPPKLIWITCGNYHQF